MIGEASRIAKEEGKDTTKYMLRLQRRLVEGLQQIFPKTVVISMKKLNLS